MPLVLVIKLSDKEQAPILDADLDFVVEPVFPSSEFQDLEIRNNGRLLKRMKNLHAGFLKRDFPNLSRSFECLDIPSNHHTDWYPPWIAPRGLPSLGRVWNRVCV